MLAKGKTAIGNINWNNDANIITGDPNNQNVDSEYNLIP
jgi:hypothetical protein